MHRIGYPTGQCVLWPEGFLFGEPGSLYLKSSELRGQKTQSPQDVTRSDGSRTTPTPRPLVPKFIYSARGDSHHLRLLI